MGEDMSEEKETTTLTPTLKRWLITGGLIGSLGLGGGSGVVAFQDRELHQQVVQLERNNAALEERVKAAELREREVKAQVALNTAHRIAAEQTLKGVSEAVREIKDDIKRLLRRGNR